MNTKNKKVLLVTETGLLNAGVPNVIMNIVRNLKDEAKFDILVFDTGTHYFDQEFTNLGGIIYKSNLLDYNNNKIIYPLRGIQIYMELKKIFSESGPYDVIHCHNGFESGICVLAASKVGVKETIVHSHGIYSISGKNFILNWYHRLCKKLIQKYGPIMIACSNQAGISLFGNNNRIINIINPIDAAKYKIKRIRKRKSNELNMLHVGYFSNNKNQLFSLKLVKTLLCIGYNIKLNFIGFEVEYGYLEKMKEYINNNNLNNNVSFLPHDYDKASIFQVTDVLILPSIKEAQGMVLLEAQAANVPCIASTNVPEESNLGLLQYAPLVDINLWINKIIKLSSFEGSINEDKLKKVDINNYIKNIRKVYNMN